MLAILDRTGRVLSLLSAGRAVLWLAQIGSLVTMVTVGAVVARPSMVWPVALIVVAGSAAMVLPDSEAGLITLLGFGAWWLAADGPASWTGVLVVALTGLVFHLSLAHAAATPSGALTEAAVVRAMVVDAGMVAAATGGAVAAGAWLESAGVRAPAFLIGVALVLVGLLPWIASLRGDRH